MPRLLNSIWSASCPAGPQVFPASPGAGEQGGVPAGQTSQRHGGGGGGGGGGAWQGWGRGEGEGVWTHLEEGKVS